MAEVTAPVTTADRVNSKLEGRILSKDVLATLESAYVPFQVTFNSALIKRVFLRFFDATQRNFHLISTYGRIHLTNPQVSQVEEALRKGLSDLDAYLKEKLRECDLLLQNNGITSEPLYLAPMSVEARVISPLSRKFLAAMSTADRIVGMIELLVIEDIVSTTRADMLCSEIRNRLRRVSTATRTFALGVQKMSQIAQAKAVKANGEDAADTAEPSTADSAIAPQGQGNGDSDSTVAQVAALAQATRKAERARRQAASEQAESVEAPPAE